MSDGYAGSNTKALGESERELGFGERVQKKLDAFSDVQPYQDAQKPDNGYQDKHTENLAGDSSQEAMDILDRMEQLISGKIKPPVEQFPEESASDNAGFDARQVDPQKISSQQLEDEVPEEKSFSNEVEKKMKLSAEKRMKNLASGKFNISGQGRMPDYRIAEKGKVGKFGFTIFEDAEGSWAGRVDEQGGGEYTFGGKRSSAEVKQEINRYCAKWGAMK